MDGRTEAMTRSPRAGVAKSLRSSKCLLPGNVMILDHIGFNVSDLAASKRFYDTALAPLGIGVAAEGDGWVMLGREGKPQFWFGSFGASPGPIHIAFAAANREQVRQFHAAALKAGGTDNGAPGLRTN